MAPRPNIPDVMSIQFLLLAQFSGRVMIPVDEVRQHYFPHLQLAQLMRKVNAGELPLPICRMEQSVKATPMVLVSHLAIYISGSRTPRSTTPLLLLDGNQSKMAFERDEREMSKPPESKRGSADVATAVVFAVLVVMAAIIVGSLFSMWLKHP